MIQQVITTVLQSRRSLVTKEKAADYLEEKG